MSQCEGEATVPRTVGFQAKSNLDGFWMRRRCSCNECNGVFLIYRHSLYDSEGRTTYHVLGCTNCNREYPFKAGKCP